IFVVLEGRARVRLGGDESEAGPGDCIIVPACRQAVSRRWFAWVRPSAPTAFDDQPKRDLVAGAAALGLRRRREFGRGEGLPARLPHARRGARSASGAPAGSPESMR